MARITPLPTLHHLSSSKSLCVLWALEEIAAEKKEFKFNLKKYQRVKGKAPDALRSVFPMGKSPIVTFEEPGESEVIYQTHPGILTESRLIFQFLSDTYSHGIWEPAPEDKSRDIFFQEFANNSFTVKADFTTIFDLIPPHLPIPLRQFIKLLFIPIIKNYKNDLDLSYQLMESSLSLEKPWFSGKRIGLADFNMCWGMDMAVARGYFPSKEYPRVAKWHESISKRPAYKMARETGGSYDLVSFDM